MRGGRGGKGGGGEGKGKNKSRQLPELARGQRPSFLPSTSFQEVA